METNLAGYFVRPTVFGNVDPASAIAQEEVLAGASIIAYDDEEDAIRIANGTPYGLAGGSGRAATNVPSAWHVACVPVRSRSMGVLQHPAPFGGYNNPAMAANWGRYGIEEFLEYKAMQFPVR